MEGYSHQRRTRPLRPLFVVGFEGPTEWNYAESIIQMHGMSCKRGSGPENRRDELLAETLHATNKHKSKNATRIVIPVIILDIENMRNQNITDYRKFATKARNQGVEVFINRPRVENWFLCHFMITPENIDSNTLDTRLAHALASAGLPTYQKPGSPQFYSALNQFTNSALAHCEASGHSMYQLPCMCQFINLVTSFR